MPNTLATPEWVIKEVGRNYINDIVFIKNVSKTYDSQYVQAGAKVGNTVNARLPQRFVAKDGQALQVQDLYDRTVPITLTNQKQVAFSYSSAQATTELDDIRNRYTMPAAETLASAADRLAFENVYRDVYQSIGTPGTTPSATLTYLQAGVKLADMAAPSLMTNGKAVLDPLAMATLANATQALFNPSATISENYTKGQFGRGQLGIGEWYQDSNRPVHVTGTFTAATPLVDGANQTGSVLNTKGWAAAASTLKKGDIFTIAGVFSVNPQGYQSTGRLKQFVVTADTADAAGEMDTLPISPPIITSGSLQTVTNSPADSAVILIWSTASGGALATTSAPTGLLFVPDAFAFVMADLDKPSAGAYSTFVRSKAAGLSIRYVEQYQIGTDQNPSRLDILIGAAAVRPEWAVRVTG